MKHVLPRCLVVSCCRFSYLATCNLNLLIFYHFILFHLCFIRPAPLSLLQLQAATVICQLAGVCLLIGPSRPTNLPSLFHLQCTKHEPFQSVSCAACTRSGWWVQSHAARMLVWANVWANEWAQALSANSEASLLRVFHLQHTTRGSWWAR